MFSSITKRILLLAACVGASSCGINSYCLSEQAYQRAHSVPEMKPVAGLSLPTTGSALRLPEAPSQPVPFGREAEDGSGVCLDKPPSIVS